MLALRPDLDPHNIMNDSPPTLLQLVYVSSATAKLLRTFRSTLR